MTRPVGIYGLISEIEGEKLAELASLVPRDEVIVEVGSARGLSTCWLAHGSRGAEIWSFDPWEEDPGGAAAFERNIEIVGAGELVRQFNMRGTDYDGPRPTVGMLFHDASHAERDILADFKFWLPSLASRSWFVCHDFVGKTWDPEVSDWRETVPRVTHEKFFERHILPRASWSDITLVDTLWSGRREV